MSFDPKIEKMGPGAASTFDPEFGKREGIGERDHYTSEQKLRNRLIATWVNQDLNSSHVLSKMAEAEKKLPAEVYVHLNRVLSSIRSWQGNGGWAKEMGVMSEQYIKHGNYDDSSAARLVDMVRAAPEQQGTLFRGMGTSAKWDKEGLKYSFEPIPVLDAMKPGDVMRLDRLSSFSTDNKSSTSFGRQYQLQVVDRYKGIKAAQNESYNGEKEVITYGRFRVVRVYDKPRTIYDDNGKATYDKLLKTRVIVVRQLETH